MSITIADVRASLAAAVATTGLRCSAYVLNNVDPPCAMVDRLGFDPRMVFGATKNAYRFRLRVFIASPQETAAQAAVDGFCATSGAQSIKAAIENGSNWTAAVDYAQVTAIGSSVEPETAGIGYVTVDFELEVVW